MTNKKLYYDDATSAEVLIRDAREIAPHEGSLTVVELLEALADALEAATSTGYDYAGADYDGTPDSVGWRQWGNRNPDTARWRRRSAGEWEPYRDWQGNLISE